MNLIKVPEANQLYLNPETGKFIFGGRVMAEQNDDFEIYNPVTDTTTTLGYWRKKLMPPPEEELNLDEPLSFDKLRERELGKQSPKITQLPTKQISTPHEDVISPHQTQSIPHDSPRTGKKNSKHKGTFIVNNVKYDSARQAAKATGLDHKTIINRCYNKLYGCFFQPK
jgi:hypothetical protein